MNVAPTSGDGLALRSYLLLSRITPPLMRVVLKRRLKRNKEHPTRYTEKLGITSDLRPAGTLVWMHGVGLGEVLALRGLIVSLHKKNSDLSFLVTSSTKVSAEVFSSNMTPNTIHQFLPLDAMSYVTKFLNHWQPDISVWAEQDLWPAMVVKTHQRNIPLIIVNARMNEKAYQSRARLGSLYADLYKRFNSISAQDQSTAKHMNQLGARATVGGSLKTAATPLADNPDKRIEFSKCIAHRQCWLLASSHHEDEALAISAHKTLTLRHPTALLIIAPRLTNRHHEIIGQCNKYNMNVATRSTDEPLQAHHNIYLADTFGEMGIWYRLVRAAFIGGSMSPVQGHNPWEAVALNCTVIHGPNVDNFSSDYATLQQHAAAICVTNKEQLLTTLEDNAGLQQACTNAKNLIAMQHSTISAIADQLIADLPNHRAAV